MGGEDFASLWIYFCVLEDLLMISIRTAAEQRREQLKRQMELVNAKRAALDETNEKVARLRAMRLEREQADEAQPKPKPKPQARRAGARRASTTTAAR